MGYFNKQRIKMNCLIIGASRGIGLALAKEYKSKGYYVEATY